LRIVSLLPAATEIVAALGGLAWLVGVSHECDYPPAVRNLPRVTRTTLDATLPSRAIDAAMAQAAGGGPAPVTLDVAALRRLAPDLILGQSLCDVCAVGAGPIADALAALERRPEVVTLHAHTLDGVFADIVRVGEAMDLGSEAEELVAGLTYRLGRVGAQHAAPLRAPPMAVSNRAPRTAPTRVLVLEWTAPAYVAGHWVPELIAAAGGENVGARAGARSVARAWPELRALAPDLVVVALCGFDVPRARRETAAVTDPDGRALLSGRVAYLDGNAYTSRPGPRLVDAAELLAPLMAG